MRQEPSVEVHLPSPILFFDILISVRLACLGLLDAEMCIVRETSTCFCFNLSFNPSFFTCPVPHDGSFSPN